MLVLLVEDEHDLAELVMEYLLTCNIECDYFDNAEAAWSQLQKQSYDALILDVNLAGKSGVELCRMVRQQGLSTPCIMLTAMHTLEDKIIGFEAGADDYLVKPFAMQELVLRLQSLQTTGKKGHALNVGDLHIQVANRHAQRADRVLKLSPDEWTLLLLLARHSPNVVSKEKIEETLWPDGMPSNDALKMLTYRLRKTLDSESEQPLLHTERGVGLVLKWL